MKTKTILELMNGQERVNQAFLRLADSILAFDKAVIIGFVVISALLIAHIGGLI